MESDAEIALLWCRQVRAYVSYRVVPRVILLHIINLEIGEAVD